ncbi:MAG: L,D-transpeptidase family protein [Patescibacteria group bacterium]
MTTVKKRQNGSFALGIRQSASALAILLAWGFFIPVAPLWAAESDLTDTDHDGLTDLQETSIYFTDPTLPDTDGDDYDDLAEIRNGYSPRHGAGARLIQVDSDSDYLNDAWELVLGTGLMNPDSDGDLYLDGTEVAASYNPLDPSSKKLEKLIKVDLARQRLEYSFAGKQFGAFPISSGISGMSTPRGEFSILDKQPSKDYGGRGFGFYYPDTKWNLHFTTQRWRYYIHGAYWHNDFGRPKSHGCVNVSYNDMEALYWWAQVGTKVVIN